MFKATQLDEAELDFEPELSVPHLATSRPKVGGLKGRPSRWGDPWWRLRVASRDQLRKQQVRSRLGRPGGARLG